MTVDLIISSCGSSNTRRMPLDRGVVMSVNLLEQAHEKCRHS